MPNYEYDKDYPFAAFVTNLGKYNEGELVGEWVKFPTTADEMKKVFVGVCIVIAVLGFNFVGDGLRDALDPKARR